MLAKSDIQRGALSLPARERIELVVKLWDSLAPGDTVRLHLCGGTTHSAEP